MANTFTSNLHIWDGGRPECAESGDFASTEALDVHGRREQLDRLYLRETFLKKNRKKGQSQPLSLDWFLEIERVRYGRYGRWLPRLLEFGKHGGEKLLGMGLGLGTDWAQYAGQGAEVVICSSSSDQLAMVERNFALRGQTARFVHADATVLPLETASIDVACISTFLENPAAPAPAAVVHEAYRVLKPGGKVLALAPAAYNVEFWCRNWLPWRRSRANSRSHGQTARDFRRLFDRFVEPRVWKRQLRRSDLPHVLRLFPPSILERIMGRFLVLKAFKPVHIAVTTPMAA